MKARQHVLVTGGAGFIGTNLADRLLREGIRVLVLDTLARPGVEQNLRWLHAAHRDLLDVEISDVRNRRAMSRAVRSASAIFHLAAQVAVTTSLVEPLEDFDVNARGTLGLLEAVRARTTAPPLLYTSTNEVYGALDDLELRTTATRYEPASAALRARGIGEERGLEFHSPHGCSKGAADQYVLDYARTYRLPAIVFRMSCIYGPHQHGNEDQGWVAHLLRTAMLGQPITIHGDGKQVRDVLFVEDLVDAFLLAKAHVRRLAGEVFNIGGGPANTVSLLELVDLIEELEGERPTLRFGDWRTADQRYYVSDVSCFARATGWRPTVSVAEGVRQLHAWLIGVLRMPAPGAAPVEAQF